MSENVGASTSRNPKGLHGLYRDKRMFFTEYSLVSAGSLRSESRGTHDHTITDVWTQLIELSLMLSDKTFHFLTAAECIHRNGGMFSGVKVARSCTLFASI
jgi:hypothetical protein